MCLAKKTTIGLLVLAFAAVTPVLFQLEVYHAELLSPDKRYRAVASKHWIYGLMPTLPGQGSDAPGSITLYRTDTGVSLGKRPVDMVSFLVDLRWSEHQAWIPAVARWQL